MAITALQVRSQGSWTLLPKGNPGVKSKAISPEAAGLGERAAEFCSCSIAKACLILCDRMDCSTPGIPVLHHLLEFLATDHVISWQVDGEAMEIVTDFLFLGPKITADGDCSHEIKKHLLLGRKDTYSLEGKL